MLNGLQTFCGVESDPLGLFCIKSVSLFHLGKFVVAQIHFKGTLLFWINFGNLMVYFNFSSCDRSHYFLSESLKPSLKALRC